MTTLLERVLGVPAWPDRTGYRGGYESIDGPRYAEAVRGAREMRRRTAKRWARRDRRYHFVGWMNRAWICERQRGIPELWISR